MYWHLPFKERRSHYHLIIPGLWGYTCSEARVYPVLPRGDVRVIIISHTEYVLWNSGWNYSDETCCLFTLVCFCGKNELPRQGFLLGWFIRWTSWFRYFLRSNFLDPLFFKPCWWMQSVVWVCSSVLTEFPLYAQSITMPIINFCWDLLKLLYSTESTFGIITH